MAGCAGRRMIVLTHKFNARFGLSFYEQKCAAKRRFCFFIKVSFSVRFTRLLFQGPEAPTVFLAARFRFRLSRVSPFRWTAGPPKTSVSIDR